GGGARGARDRGGQHGRGGGAAEGQQRQPQGRGQRPERAGGRGGAAADQRGPTAEDAAQGREAGGRAGRGHRRVPGSAGLRRADTAAGAPAARAA
ncbi:DEAD/DEAH box helicase, partial [Mycobacterium tuberculosis]